MLLYQVHDDCSVTRHQRDVDFNSDKRQAIQSSLDELAAILRDLMTVSSNDSIERISSKLDETRTLLDEFEGDIIIIYYVNRTRGAKALVLWLERRRYTGFNSAQLGFTRPRSINPFIPCRVDKLLPW
jgi:hypothetical protein